MNTANSIENIFHQSLFSDPVMSVYAVVDGAAIPDLINQLNHYQAEYICLYRGKIDLNLANVAPYLVALPPKSDVTQWVLSQAGNHPGIFASSTVSMSDMLKHFRTLLMGYNTENRPIYIRYYDPRLLGAFLATLEGEARQEFFGPIVKYYAEQKTGKKLDCFLADQLEQTKKDKN
jgi:hypothetical protein